MFVLFAVLCAALSMANALSPSMRNSLRQEITNMGYGSIFNGLTTDAEIDSMIQRFHTPAMATISSASSHSALDLHGPAKKKIDPAAIWAIGKGIWTAVKENEPVVDVQRDWAGAVPDGIDDWTVLDSWKDFISEPYNITFVNFLNARLTQLEWNWEFKYNGGMDGTGQYVTMAGASIKNVYAYLTESVNVEIESFNAVNYGSRSNPVSGIDLELRMTSQGLFEKTIVACHVEVRGDGTFKEVACQNGIIHT